MVARMLITAPIRCMHMYEFISTLCICLTFPYLAHFFGAGGAVHGSFSISCFDNEVHCHPYENLGMLCKVDKSHSCLAFSIPCSFLGPHK